MLLRLCSVKVWEAGLVIEDTEGSAFSLRALNMHRLGMEMTMRAEIVTPSGKYVRELFLR